MRAAESTWEDAATCAAFAANDVEWHASDSEGVAPENEGVAEADDRAASFEPQTDSASRPTGACDDADLAALIQRVCRHDERAFESLYDRTAGRVYGLVLRITSCAALAEEVVEDTFWQVWRQAPRFDAARGRPLTWLLAMARTRAIDALRRNERFAHDTLPDEDALDDGPLRHDLAGAFSAPDLLQATRSEDALHEALAALEPRARQLISLAFFRGMTHEEIAAQERMPLGSVKSLIRRALQQLRRRLAPATGTPS